MMTICLSYERVEMFAVKANLKNLFSVHFFFRFVNDLLLEANKAIRVKNISQQQQMLLQLLSLLLFLSYAVRHLHSYTLAAALSCLIIWFLGFFVGLNLKLYVIFISQLSCCIHINLNPGNYLSFSFYINFVFPICQRIFK